MNNEKADGLFVAVQGNSVWSGRYSRKIKSISWCPLSCWEKPERKPFKPVVVNK